MFPDRLGDGRNAATSALLAKTMPARHHGWALVLGSGLVAVGGYIAASEASALLQPAQMLGVVALETDLAEAALLMHHLSRVHGFAPSGSVAKPGGATCAVWNRAKSALNVGRVSRGLEEGSQLRGGGLP